MVNVGIDDKNEAVNALENFKFETVSLRNVNKPYGLDVNNKARGDIACSQCKRRNASQTINENL